jgi:hypothetical protein
MATAIFCTVKTKEKAEQIVSILKNAGFPARDISVLMQDKQSAKDFSVDNETKAPEGAAIGASTGAVVGGGLGWLVGIGALAIPGVGPLIAAGPIMAALSGVALGGAVGGLSGALIGMGIPEYEAKRYSGKLEAGHSLIAVHSETADDTTKARRIFEAENAEDISTSSEPATTHR